MDTAALADEYARDGYVRIRQFLNRQELDEARRELDRYVRELAPNLQSHEYTMEADGKTVRNLWRMEQYDAFFRSLAGRTVGINTAAMASLEVGDGAVLRCGRIQRDPDRQDVWRSLAKVGVVLMGRHPRAHPGRLVERLDRHQHGISMNQSPGQVENRFALAE